VRDVAATLGALATILIAPAAVASKHAARKHQLSLAAAQARSLGQLLLHVVIHRGGQVMDRFAYPFSVEVVAWEEPQR